ncbi:MAG: ATP-binding protein, partial [Anaerolineae bacterium]
SFAALPLRSGDAVFGVLGLGSTAKVDFGEQASFLETIADQVAVALENARLSRQAAELEVMREVDQLRSKLLADVSHELRTPLGLIKILASTLLREDVVFDREIHVEFLQDIDDEADKLMQLVDNLLGLGRAESGRLRLARQPVDLVSIVDRAVGLLQTQFLQHRFVQDLPDPPLVVDADAGKLEQVMRNLLDNAAKYSPEGTMIKVVGQVVEGEVLVRVIDQGMGIAEEDLGRIFERFYRVDNEITRRTRGVGLGLSLCQEIVNAHGGLIWVESVLGRGSTFSFSLPLSSETGR